MKQTVDWLFFLQDRNRSLFGRTENSPDWLVQSGEFAVQSHGNMKQSPICFISPPVQMNFSLVSLCQSLDCADIPGDGIDILLCETEQSQRKITPFWRLTDQVGSNGLN